MITFTCHCGQKSRLFFENTSCSICNRMVGYVPDDKKMHAFEPIPGTQKWKACDGDKIYRQCKNYSKYNVCNWMIPDEENEFLCSACQLTDIIPNLGQPDNLLYWSRLETAKRRLLYTLYSLKLPVMSKKKEPEKGLLFRFLTDKQSDSNFIEPLINQEPIYTGHHRGIITINIAEADNIARASTQIQMRETYRTLLGHFRHEIGHYFWELLVGLSKERLKQFHDLFGDEQINYEEARTIYYQQGPPDGWEKNYISAYAAMHPWEDWAETWAHYFHMIDSLETSRDFGLIVKDCTIAAKGELQNEPNLFKTYRDENEHFNTLINDWMYLSICINALNRSMGIEDFYPFTLYETIRKKLRFIHKAILSFTLQKDLM